MEEALTTKDGQVAYRESKKFAEVAAWDFVEKEKPNFTLTTLNPPMVFGPVLQRFNSLGAINTSNKRFLGMVQGKFKGEQTGPTLWVDVRDLAEAHVLAIETPEAAGKRFFITAGSASEKEVGKIIQKNFQEIADSIQSGLNEKQMTFGADTRCSREELGLTYRSLESCVVDLVKSLFARDA